MLSEELDLECEKLTAEWVHVEICRPMCNVLNMFDEKNFEIVDAICNDHNVAKFKQQVAQNITNSLEALNKLKKLMDDQDRLLPDDVSAIKKATILSLYDSFLEMRQILNIALNYVSAHTEVAKKGYGFGDNENVVFYRDLLHKKLELYKKHRKTSKAS